jgi:hypothetical protein
MAVRRRQNGVICLQIARDRDQPRDRDPNSAERSNDQLDLGPTPHNDVSTKAL